MKPIDISQIGKISSTESGTKDKVSKKTSSKFDEILDSEISVNKQDKTKKVDNIMPSSQLINIKKLSDEKIFIEKGLELCDKVNNILSKVSSCSKDNKNIKNLFSNLNETVNQLLKVSENIEDKPAKDIINRAVFVSNIELEKFIRGDYS